MVPFFESLESLTFPRIPDVPFLGSALAHQVAACHAMYGTTCHALVHKAPQGKQVQWEAGQAGWQGTRGLGRQGRLAGRKAGGRKAGAINAGRDSKSMKQLTNADHVNRGIFIQVIPGARMVNTVVMKLTPPSVEDAPSIIIPARNAVAPALAP